MGTFFLNFQETFLLGPMEKFWNLRKERASGNRGKE
jgi:hypothetical protein